MKNMTHAQFKKAIKSNLTELVSAAKEVFAAMAYTQSIRPIVEGYKNQVIAEMDAINEFDGTPITDFHHDYCMGESKFAIYIQKVNAARDKAGFKVPNDDYCPLLMAESAERAAKAKLCKVLENVTGLTYDQVVDSGLDNFKKYIDLNLSYLAPYCK